MLQKIFATLILDESQGVVTNVAAVSIFGGLHVTFSSARSLEVALGTGLKLHGLNEIFQFRRVHRGEWTDPPFCFRCLEYVAHTGKCPNPVRCRTCGDQDHAEVRTGLSTRCPYNQTHELHVDTAHLFCIHCHGRHKANSRSCPVRREAIEISRSHEMAINQTITPTHQNNPISQAISSPKSRDQTETTNHTNTPNWTHAHAKLEMIGQITLLSNSGHFQPTF
jgi:hypothetical protein